jgi:hypothetical protein
VSAGACGGEGRPALHAARPCARAAPPAPRPIPCRAPARAPCGAPARALCGAPARAPCGAPPRAPCFAPACAPCWSPPRALCWDINTRISGPDSRPTMPRIWPLTPSEVAAERRNRALAVLPERGWPSARKLAHRPWATIATRATPPAVAAPGSLSANDGVDRATGSRATRRLGRRGATKAPRTGPDYYADRVDDGVMATVKGSFDLAALARAVLLPRGSDVFRSSSNRWASTKMGTVVLPYSRDTMPRGRSVSPTPPA